jgi:hypothetical protein
VKFTLVTPLVSVECQTQEIDKLCEHMQEVIATVGEKEEPEDLITK